MIKCINHDKIIKCIKVLQYFRSSNKSIFYLFFIIFFTYKKMVKDTRANYYRDNKERLQKNGS